MKKSRKNRRVKRSIFSLSTYFAFFLLVASSVVVCILLFTHKFGVIATDMTQDTISVISEVLFLSLIYSVVFRLTRGVRIEKPIDRILEATEKIGKGDFNVVIKPIHKGRRKNEFDIIIEDINNMTRELKSVETMRLDFISNVSHELKNPLAVVYNYGTLLQQPGLSEEQRIEYAKKLSAFTKKSSDLITNILRLNKIENQNIFPQCESYNLGEQLCECILNYENEWAHRNIEIDARIEEDVIIFADCEMLSLVWTNLISNALKFTPDGGNITVSLKTQGDMATVCVKDNGIGMTEDVKQRIFEKFYQGDVSHSTSGNGLGLALVKEVLDIMGGKISVESTPGEGSSFAVVIPVDK